MGVLTGIAARTRAATELRDPRRKKSNEDTKREHHFLRLARNFCCCHRGAFGSEISGFTSQREPALSGGNRAWPRSKSGSLSPMICRCASGYKGSGERETTC